MVSAFPGLGKTYAVQNSNLSLIDSDSSNFSWIYDNNGNKTDVRNPEFPQNYIDYIKKNVESLPEDSVIFVSSHENVKKAMDDAGIEFISVYPKKNCKLNYIETLKQRVTGLNDDKFISLIESNWDKWIPDRYADDIDYKKYKNCIRTVFLGFGIHLLDIITDLPKNSSDLSIYTICNDDDEEDDD